jgi:hypothetical protein
VRNSIEKRTNPVARLFAVLFAILFVIIAVTCLLIFNSLNQAFNPEVYKQALSATGVYDRLPELIGEQIVYTINKNPCVQNSTACSEEQQNATPAYLSGLDASEWAVILSELVDPTWFKTQIESAIDQVIAFLVTPGESFNLNISLVEFKALLGGDNGYQAVVSLLNSLEPCTPIAILNLPGTMLETDNPTNLPLCRPSESVLKLGESAIRDTLKSLADKLPDNTAAIINTSIPGLESGLVVSQRCLQLLRTTALISLAIPIFLLLIITLLDVRSLKDFLKWWGILMVSIAVLVFLSSLLITPLVRIIVLERVNAIGLAPGWIEVVKTAIIQVVETFRNTLTFQAGILLAFGCLMVIGSALIRSKSEIKSD